jgi:hypothetical protein
MKKDNKVLGVLAGAGLVLGGGIAAATILGLGIVGASQAWIVSQQGKLKDQIRKEARKKQSKRGKK